MPDPLDGFHVEIDIRRERGDVILDRPPLNVIAMAQREQLRAAFEALDANEHVRIVVVRASTCSVLASAAIRSSRRSAALIFCSVEVASGSSTGSIGAITTRGSS